MTGAMSVAAREAFLAEAHIAVISMAAEDDRAPLAVPMWYGYEPGGDITLITSRDSRKAALIRRGGRLSVCAQTTEPPRRYVSVEGEVVEIRESVSADERRALARRYLGAAGGDAFVDSSPDRTAEMILIRVRPRRWLSRG